MNRAPFVLALLLSVIAPKGALADDPPPPSGLGMAITGGALTAVGALNLVTLPVCRADSYVEIVGEDGSDACFVGGLVFAVGGIGVGVPLGLVGLKRHREFKDWKDAHQLSLAVAPQSGGAALGARLRF